MNTKIRNFAVVFMVRNIDRTEQFYRDTLGIQLERQPGGDGPDWLYAKVNEGLELLFFVGEESVGRSPVLVFGLHEGHIDTVVEELAAKGVEIVTPVSEAPGGWSAEFLDPDGYLLSFFQSEELPRRRS